MAHASIEARPAARAARRSDTKARSAPSTRQPDVIALLKSDHREVAAMHKAYQKLVDGKADAGARGELAAKICRALSIHAQAEEDVFYTALRDTPEADDLLDEAAIEHACAKSLIAQIEALDPDDDKYDARVVVLCEYIAHHVKEEEGEMFPQARKSGELDLKALGEAFARRKAELQQRSEAKARR
jgi:hemerythrin superfamily protein